MLNGVRVSSYSHLIESWNCIMEGRVTETGARESASVRVQSPLLEMGWYGCEYGGYRLSSGPGYV